MFLLSCISILQLNHNKDKQFQENSDYSTKAFNMVSYLMSTIKT
jgi:hypothetical protein